MKNAMLALLLAVTGASAQTTDFETRYHEIYLLEVVQGKIADAAQRYLELAREKGLPAHLRAQCRFRFAVTCVLLGRADEARALLAALAQDPALPAALKPQVEQYLKGIRAIGTGSALKKRLDDLVFELGRASAASDPMVYRDFQIIGKPALPRLRQLLNHPDKGLQMHAFRILCRMNEPGLAALWRSEWMYGTVGLDLAQYMTRNPRELPALERRLRTTDAEHVQTLLRSRLGEFNLSLETLDALARKGNDNLLEVVGLLIRRRPWDDGVFKLLARWMRDGPDPLARVAAPIYAAMCADEKFIAQLASPQLFPVLCRLLRGYSIYSKSVWPGGVEANARRMPPPVLLKVLASLVASKDDPALKAKPLRSGLADIVASAFDARATKAEDIARYVGLLRQWLAWLETSPLLLTKEDASRLTSHLRFAVTHLKPAEAATLTREIFTRAQAGRGRVGKFADVLGFERTEDVPLILAALGACSGGERMVLINAIWARTSKGRLNPACATALARAYPEAVGLAGAKAAHAMMSSCRALAAAVPPEDGVRMVQDVFRAARAKRFSSSVLAAMVSSLYGDGSSLTSKQEERYWRRVAVPAFAGVWTALDPYSRATLAIRALEVLDPTHPHGANLGDTRKDLAAALRPRMYQTLDFGGYRRLTVMPNLFPIEEWLAKAEPRTVLDLAQHVPDAVALRAGRYFAEHPGQVNEAVLTFIDRRVKGNPRGEIASRLYEQADTALLQRLGRHPGLRPTRPETLEKALTRLLADKQAKLADLSKLGSLVAELRPSKQLFPLVRRLLASTDRALVRVGIKMARGLGREELVADLLEMLDSMHADLRSQARTAIDSILELRRIKEEVRERIGDKK